MEEYAHEPSIPQSLTQTNLTCTKCGYLLDGLNLREHCPECGIKIVNECFWCDYDLSNTAPDSKCPECGVPVFASIGQGVLATVPYEKLKTIHDGMKFVTVLILVYIVTVVATMVVLGAATVSATLSNTSMHIMVVIAAIVNNTILLAIVYGWHMFSAPLTEIPRQLDANDRRTFLRTMNWIFAVTTVATLLLALIPTNYSSTAAPTAVDIISGLLSLASVVIMLIYFIAQVRYVEWIAKLVRNRKMERRAKHLVWSGPLISILGFIILFIGPLIALILYWNMIEYTRRDLKKIVQRAERLA